jgi:AmpD protein
VSQAKPKQYHVESGWLVPARRLPSPNCGPRPCGEAVSLLVVHCISLPPGRFGGNEVERFFTNCLDFDEHPWFEQIRGVEVSAHLYIRRSGELTQFVSFDERAWHAGSSCHAGREECNDFSIGIELEGCDELPYDPRQYRVLAAVSRALMQAYPGITPENIVGHCDIAPERKTDPGPAFDWRLYRQLLQE